MNKKILLGLVVLLVFSTLLFGCTTTTKQAKDTNSSPTGNFTGSSSGTTKVINLDATRWSYSQQTITVKQGDHVIINVNNVDTTHGIAIPDYGVSGIESVDFVATKTGTFQFRCPTMCGSGHKTMTGTLIVE